MKQKPSELELQQEVLRFNWLLEMHTDEGARQKRDDILRSIGKMPHIEICEAIDYAIECSSEKGSTMDIKELQQIIQLVIDMRPRPTQVNQSQAAEMLGLSSPTVKKLILHGKIKLNPAGQIPITEIDKFALPADK